jgi:hypothetical protein
LRSIAPTQATGSAGPSSKQRIYAGVAVATIVAAFGLTAQAESASSTPLAKDSSSSSVGAIPDCKAGFLSSTSSFADKNVYPAIDEIPGEVCA